MLGGRSSFQFASEGSSLPAVSVSPRPSGSTVGTVSLLEVGERGRKERTRTRREGKAGGRS